MASNKLEAGVELSPSGNSGNPAKSFKPSLADMEKLRLIPHNGQAKQSGVASEVTAITPGQAQPSDTTTSSSSSQNTATTGLGDFGDSGSYPLDTYRRDPVGGSRKLGLDGVAPSEDDKPATISVSRYNNEKIINGFSRFFLQSVREAEQEKFQIVETFTSYYTFFYGKRPPIYTYAGILLNDDRHAWMNDFRFIYENFLRGTASAELGAYTVISYDKRTVSGFVLNLNIQQDAASDKGVPFSIDVLVLNHQTTLFSQDYQAFIQQRTQELAALRARALDDISRLTRGVDGNQNSIKNQVLNGLLPPSLFGKKPAKTVSKKNTAESPATKDSMTNPALPGQSVDPAKTQYGEIVQAVDTTQVTTSTGVEQKPSTLKQAFDSAVNKITSLF